MSGNSRCRHWRSIVPKTSRSLSLLPYRKLMEASNIKVFGRNHFLLFYPLLSGIFLSRRSRDFAHLVHCTTASKTNVQCRGRKWEKHRARDEERKKQASRLRTQRATRRSRPQPSIITVTWCIYTLRRRCGIDNYSRVGYIPALLYSLSAVYLCIHPHCCAFAHT